MKTITLLSCLSIAFAAGANGQIASVPTPIAASAPTLVPALVPYAGVALSADGKPLAGDASATFLLFKEEHGGEPLWIESQTVTIDGTGHYQVKLGASSSNGLPLDTFASGEVRWLEVQIAGQTIGPRTLLTSVPYAMKAADAATLGGLPASAFVLASQVSGSAQVNANTITPNASTSSVTTTGGTNFYLPKFNAATTVINSQIYDNGKSVGIGDVPNASAKLDVNGAMIMRGNMQVTRTGNATASKGAPSWGFQFYSNAYDSASKANDNPYFQLQSEPVNNNTPYPSATFNLLFSNYGSTPAETGFSINADGTINFATGQTFPATSSSGTAVDGTSSSGIAVQGTSASGTGVQGVSTSSYGVEGTSTLGPGVLGYTAGNTLNTAGVVGQAGQTSGFGGIAGVWGDAYSHVGVFGSSNSYPGVQGTSNVGNGVHGVSTGTSGVFGETSSTSAQDAGVFGYSHNAAQGVYGFSPSNAGVQGVSTSGPGVHGTSSTSYGGQFTAGGSSAAVYAVNNAASGGVSFSGTSTGTDGLGLYVNAQGQGGTAIEGIAAAGPDSNGIQPIGVYGYSTANGVQGQTQGGVLNTAGVLGVANLRTGFRGISGVWGDAVGHIGVIGSSDQYPGVLGNSGTGDGVDGISTSRAGIYGIGGSSSVSSYASTWGSVPLGVWGDTSGYSRPGATAVGATTTNGEAGTFVNNSNGSPTIHAYNYGSGGTLTDVIFRTFEAATPDGTCGFGGKGDMTCTGQVKSLATTGNGTRTVETYSMQSPENWMEDFGSGTLHNGIATISLEAGFAETVSGNADYHVFLTPNGDSKGLYVFAKTATSFEVRESGGGTSTIGFDYRIVAKRRGLEAQRMVDVTDAMTVVKARNAQAMERFKSAAENTRAAK
jgi:hypothetical protein